MNVSYLLPAFITTQELLELTMSTVESLRAANTTAELVVVDNASTLGGGYLRSIADVYIRNQENLGYPKAMNQAIKIARGYYLAFCNNDIRVSPNWFAVAKEILEKNWDVASVHFRMLPYDEPFSYGNDTWVTGKERWCTQSFFVLNREVGEQFFDETYGLGGYDDWDWQHRLRHVRKLKTAYTNKACYQHRDSATQNLRDQKERVTSDTKNRQYFKEKFGRYPEEIWKELYLKQMQEPWRPFP